MQRIAVNVVWQPILAALFLLYVSIDLTHQQQIDETDYCDDNCMSSGRFCVKNHPQKFTECDEETRFVQTCAGNSVFNYKTNECVEPGPGIPNCRCSYDEEETTTIEASTTTTTPNKVVPPKKINNKLKQSSAVMREKAAEEAGDQDIIDDLEGPTDSESSSHEPTPSAHNTDEGEILDLVDESEVGDNQQHITAPPRIVANAGVTEAASTTTTTITDDGILDLEDVTDEQATPPPPPTTTTTTTTTLAIMDDDGSDDDGEVDSDLSLPSSTMLLVSNLTLSQIDDRCLACICQRESGCNPNFGCRDGFCGPYQLSKAVYRECGVDGGGFEACANTLTCSETCIRNYLKVYSQKCVLASSSPTRQVPTCQDHVRIYHGGPNGCRVDYTAIFWEKIRLCYTATE